MTPAWRGESAASDTGELGQRLTAEPFSSCVAGIGVAFAQMGQGEQGLTTRVGRYMNMRGWQMDDYAATVPVACDSCTGQNAGEVYETIIDDRLHWVLTHACVNGFVESMGWDETPVELRQAILDQCGTYRLSLSEEPIERRLAMLKVLRGSGMAMTDVLEVFAHLSGPGIAGTEAELRLVAGRLFEVRCRFGSGTSLRRR